MWSTKTSIDSKSKQRSQILLKAMATWNLQDEAWLRTSNNCGENKDTKEDNVACLFSRFSTVPFVQSSNWSDVLSDHQHCIDALFSISEILEYN